MVTALVYDPKTGKVSGTLMLTQDADLPANTARAEARGQAVLLVPPDHPGLHTKDYTLEEGEKPEQVLP